GVVKDRSYRASQGLESDLLENLKKLYGFDKPIGERYLLMLKKYLQFDFGESFYRQIKVIDLIKEKLPVSISLGFFSTLLIYLISIPLGIFKAKRNNEPLDVLSSVVIIVANAIPVFYTPGHPIGGLSGGNDGQWCSLQGLVVGI
ncbi:ABC transporter permease family protein, partial [Helicobacter pylori]